MGCSLGMTKTAGAPFTPLLELCSEVSHISHITSTAAQSDKIRRQAPPLLVATVSPYTVLLYLSVRPVNSQHSNSLAAH